MKKRNTSKQVNALTVRELQTWLDGYCSAHGNDWSPTPEQWKMIKNKIFALSGEEVRPVSHTSTPPPLHHMVAVPIQQPLPASAIQPRESAMPFQQGQNGALKTPDKLDGSNGSSDFA